MKTLKILHVLRAPVGGLFRHVCDLASEQANVGHHVGIVYADNALSSLAQSKFDDIAPKLVLGLHPLRMARGLGFGDYLASKAVRTIVHKTSPHVLHGHGAKGGAYARLAAYLYNKSADSSPIHSFYTPHGGSLHYHKKPIKGAIYAKLERSLAKMGSGIIFESHYSQSIFADMVGLGYCASTVVPNGLQATEFTPVETKENATDLIFIGELRKLKGIDTLLEAVARLNKLGKTYHLDIVGDGPDENAFKQLVQARDLDGQVRFLGRQPAGDMFANGKLLIIPSRAESFPYIVLEAGACALPMVVTNVGGIHEITSQSKQQLITPDDPSILATAIDEKLSNYAMAKDIAKDLRRSMQDKFTVEHMETQITDFYLSKL